MIFWCITITICRIRIIFRNFSDLNIKNSILSLWFCGWLITHKTPWQIVENYHVEVLYVIFDQYPVDYRGAERNYNILLFFTQKSPLLHSKVTRVITFNKIFKSKWILHEVISYLLQVSITLMKILWFSIDLLTSYDIKIWFGPQNQGGNINLGFGEKWYE